MKKTKRKKTSPGNKAKRLSKSQQAKAATEAPRLEACPLPSDRGPGVGEAVGGAGGAGHYNESSDKTSRTVELPLIAMALVLDEWRRATMEGQGGWFVRLPRDRYDGHGNLWTVVRRTVGAEERIVVICETKQYQAMASSNELRHLQAEYERKVKAYRSTLTDLEQSGNKPLRAAKLTESSEAIERDLAQTEARLDELRAAAVEKSTREWDFPLDLGTIRCTMLWCEDSGPLRAMTG